MRSLNGEGSLSCPIQLLLVTLAGLKNIVRYNGDFALTGFDMIDCSVHIKIICQAV